MTPDQVHILPNGLRVVHKPSSSPVAHCCVMIAAGSRDESENEAGMAHFIEHLLFKETRKRKSFHINNRLESVGGELNAFTTKEETCIYASFMPEFYDRTMELFSDILWNSVFPEDEIKKERKVILEEINSYKDSPADLIFDEFENLVFKEHQLGHYILGTSGTVRKINKKQIEEFYRKNYVPERMVIASSGKIEAGKLFKMAGKYFSEDRHAGGKSIREPFLNYSPAKKTLRKKTYQTHFISGTTAYSLKDQRRFCLNLLSNILGGPGMNSKLNLILREKNGLTYNVESGFLPYTDTGLFHIYFGVEPSSFGKASDLAFKEMRNLKVKKLGPVQLKNARQQLCGQLAIHYESDLNEIFTMARSLSVNNKIYSLPDIFSIIESLSDSDLLYTANEIFDEELFSTIVYNPGRKSYV